MCALWSRSGRWWFFMDTLKWLPLWCRLDGQSIVIFKYNVAWYYMSEDNFLCLTLEDDDLAVLSMLDLELANRTAISFEQFLQFCLASMEMDSLTGKLWIPSREPAKKIVLILMKKIVVTSPAY